MEIRALCQILEALLEVGGIILITIEYSGPRKSTTQVMEAGAIVANFWAAGVILRGKSATYQTEGSGTASGIPRQKNGRTLSVRTSATVQTTPI
jgi:hypothetical protein